MRTPRRLFSVYRNHPRQNNGKACFSDTVFRKGQSEKIHHSVARCHDGNRPSFPRRHTRTPHTIPPKGISQAPPDLLEMLRGVTRPSEAIRDTIPVYTAEGEVAECSVCPETIKVGDRFRVPCGVTINHCFHKDCIDPWLRQNNTCPNCRAKLD